jgi:glycosyltransferase involved in cell wall biosynthesis
MKKFSVVLATRNEEKNIGPCLESVRQLADEIIVVDEYSTDRTVELAEKYGAKVYKEPHHAIFHITKQKALEKAAGDWILQLDADERVTPELTEEIKKVMGMTDEELKNRKTNKLKNGKLFQRHQDLIEKRDGRIGKPTGEIVAFFIPRLNYFLGRPLKHAGVYPDGVIRLVKKGKARFPQKSVHEQMEVDGEVSWLSNNLEHHDSPTLKRYFSRMNRYTDLHAKELTNKKIPKNIIFLINYSLFKPLKIFLNLYFRHLGLLDGPQGFLWSLFSAMRYPIAYFKYWLGKI